MPNPRSPHLIHPFDRVVTLDGRLGTCMSADLRDVTVIFDPVGGCPPERETKPQFSTEWRWTDEPSLWNHDEWTTVEDAEERINRIESRLDDIEARLDELYSEQSGLEDELAELEEAVAKHKAALRKMAHV